MNYMDKAINIEYSIQIWKEGKQFIAHAMPLDVISSGESPQEAKHALNEAVLLFLETASDMGTLDDILSEAGYIFSDKGWLSPSWISVERHSITVGS